MLPRWRSDRGAASADVLAGLYLDLLKKCLTRSVFEDRSIIPEDSDRSPVPFDLHRRIDGRDWPTSAETMIGLKRLDNLEECITAVIRDGVRGDLIETGVWRGGAAIFMRGVLAAYGDLQRVVWVADSFEGVPKPDPETYPADAGDRLWAEELLAVGREEVERNFARYGLLDDQVRFLPGWFRDTLPSASIERLAVLRLDGDLYESTMVALESLYPKLSPGGFVIIDDYALPTCRAAVDDFRAARAITVDMKSIDWTGVYWRVY